MKNFNIQSLFIKGPFGFYFFIFISIFIASCMPKATQNTANCGTNQAFDPVTRSCYSIAAIYYPPEASLTNIQTTQETPVSINLTYFDRNGYKAIGCAIDSTLIANNIFMASPIILDGSIYVTESDLRDSLSNLESALQNYYNSNNLAVPINVINDALNNISAIDTSANKARTSYYIPTIETELGLINTNAANLISSAANYLADSGVSYYYNIALTKKASYQTAYNFVSNKCYCSGGICTTYAIPKKDQAGNSGFSYTVSNIVGTSIPKTVSLSIAAMSKSTSHYRPAVESGYMIGAQSAVTAPVSYAFTLPEAHDYFSTASFTYSPVNPVVSSNYVISDSGLGKISGCLGMGGSAANSLNCIYTPNSGDYSSTTTPALAQVTIGDIVYTALANGVAGNNIKIYYEDIGSNITSIDPFSTAYEKYGLISGTNEVYTRVYGNNIYVIFHNGVTTTAQIVSAIGNDIVAGAMVNVSGGSTAVGNTANASNGVNLAGGVGGYDSFSYKVSNGFLTSTNTAKYEIQITKTEHAPVINSVASRVSGTGSASDPIILEDSGPITINLTPTYAPSEVLFNDVSMCDAYDNLNNFTINSCTCTINVNPNLSNCSLVVTPNANVSSTVPYTIYYRACTTDLSHCTPYTDWSIYLTPVNDTPIISAIGPQSVNESTVSTSTSGNFAFTAGSGNAYENQALTITASSNSTTILSNTTCTGYVPGSGSPISNITPTAVGKLYYDFTNHNCWISNGTTNTSWALYPNLTVIPDCNGTTKYGSGSPLGVVTPSQANDYYLDVTNNQCYISTSTLNTSWSNKSVLQNIPYHVIYATNQYQAGTVVITLNVKDDGGVTNGGVDTINPAPTVNLTVNPVNESPKFLSTITSVSTNEGGTVIAGPFKVDEDQGNSPSHDFLNMTITSITSSDQSVLSDQTGIAVYYDVNDNGVFDSGEIRTVGAIGTGSILEPINPSTGLVDASNADAAAHNFYLILKPVGGVSGNANITITVSNGAKNPATGTPFTATTTFSLVVNPVAAIHGGWSNISAIGIKTDKFGLPVAAGDIATCNYNRSGDLHRCNNTDCTGTTTPVGNSTPDAANVIYWDSANQVCYRSTGTTAYTWVSLKTSCPITRSPTCQYNKLTDINNCTVGSTATNCTGSGSPISSVTPSAANVVFWDSTNSICYISKDKTSTSWVQTSVCSNENCIQSSDPTSTAVNQYYYNPNVTADQSCKQSYLNTTTNPATYAWQTYVPSKVTLTWKPFTLSGTGADINDSISGYQVFRRKYNVDYDLTKPIATITGQSTLTYTDTTANANTLYYYTVRPVDNNHGKPTYTPNIFSEVRVIAPPPNYAFVHRWMINQEICNKMHMTTTTTANPVDPTNNFRCPYVGPGGTGTGYYDYGQDLLVDISEMGCPYTLNTAGGHCSVGTNGCIGMTDVTLQSFDSTPVTNDIYYDRSSGTCSVYNGTTWTSYDAAGKNTATYASEIIASKDKYSTALNPPLVNVTNTAAVNICNQRTSPTITNISALSNPSLPTKKDYMAYSAAPDGMADADVADLELGTSLNITSRCNGSGADGLQTYYTDSAIPPSSYIYTLPGTYTSNIRSIVTGSVPWGYSQSTQACVSRYGIQDIYGNVAQWVQDQMKCSSPYICTSVVGTAINYDFYASSTCTTQSGAGFPGCHYTQTGAATPVGNTTPNGIGVYYWDSSGSKCYVSNGLTNASWSLVATTAPSAAGAQYLDTTANKCYIATGTTADTWTPYPAGNPHNYYAFDLVTGPYNDANGDSWTGAGDAWLTSWDYKDMTYSSGKFSFPVGMPINTDIATLLPNSTALSNILNIGTTAGITTDQFHGDGIIVNGLAVNTDSTQTGAFAVGGSYLSGAHSGRYTSELIPLSTSRKDVGFRCIVPIPNGKYPFDSFHPYKSSY